MPFHWSPARADVETVRATGSNWPYKLTAVWLQEQAPDVPTFTDAAHASKAEQPRAWKPSIMYMWRAGAAADTGNVSVPASGAKNRTSEASETCDMDRATPSTYVSRGTSARAGAGSDWAPNSRSLTVMGVGEDGWEAVLSVGLVEPWVVTVKLTPRLLPLHVSVEIGLQAMGGGAGEGSGVGLADGEGLVLADGEGFADGEALVEGAGLADGEGLEEG
jgi:hypothetical protein